MFKLFFLITFLILTFNIYSCENFSGKYRYSDTEENKVDFEFKQSNCKEIEYITAEIQVLLNDHFQKTGSIIIMDSQFDIFQKVNFTNQKMLMDLSIQTVNQSNSSEQNIQLEISKLESGDLDVVATYDDGHIENLTYKKVF